MTGHPASRLLEQIGADVRSDVRAWLNVSAVILGADRFRNIVEPLIPAPGETPGVAAIIRATAAAYPSRRIAAGRLRTHTARTGQPLPAKITAAAAVDDAYWNRRRLLAEWATDGVDVADERVSKIEV